MTNQRANAGRKDWRRICGPVVCSPSGSKVTRIRRVFISGGEYKVRPYEPNGGFARLGKKGHDPDRTAWLDRGRVLYVARVTGLEPATSSVTGCVETDINSAWLATSESDNAAYSSTHSTSCSSFELLAADLQRCENSERNALIQHLRFLMQLAPRRRAAILGLTEVER